MTAAVPGMRDGGGHGGITRFDLCIAQQEVWHDDRVQLLPGPAQSRRHRSGPPRSRSTRRRTGRCPTAVTPARAILPASTRTSTSCTRSLPRASRGPGSSRNSELAPRSRTTSFRPPSSAFCRPASRRRCTASRRRPAKNRRNGRKHTLSGPPRGVETKGQGGLPSESVHRILLKRGAALVTHAGYLRQEALSQSALFARPLG